MISNCYCILFRLCVNLNSNSTVDSIAFGHNHGKPAGLTVVQLTKVTKPGCRMLCRCIDQYKVNRKLTRRGKCGIKRSTLSLNDHNCERIARKSNFRNLEKLQKEWTEAGVNASSAPMHKYLQEWSYSSSWTRDGVRNIVLGLKKTELDCCLMVQSPLYRWKWFSFYFLVLCQGRTVWRKVKRDRI